MNCRTFLKLLLAAIASAPLSACADVLDPQPMPPPTNTRQPQNTPEPQNENTPPNAATPAPQNSPTSPADSDIAFEPPLPKNKQQAITRVGMGLLDKCYLIFPKAFWHDTTLLGYLGERKGEWAEWLNLGTLLGVPVLLGFNAGAYARILEAKTDAQILQSAMDTLRQIYSNDIPNPIDYRITRWAQDPFALGSYSFLGVNATPKDYDTLAQPIGERLFFAGEHTQRDHPSTVHGAYLSGERAAREILDL